MTIRLDHCNIRSFDIDATVAFYTGLLGLREGSFAGPRSTGAWLYDATDRPVVHVVAIDPEHPEPAFARIAERLGALAGRLDRATMSGGGAIDHVAFECDDYDGMLARIRERGLPYSESHVASVPLRQIFVNDPSGVTVELNFR
jgi:catechol 2,3-dioxygenase-like lactoylglutathione lyase family enzyme